MRHLRTTLAIAALLLPALAVQAQEAPSPGGPPPASTAPPPSDDDVAGHAGTLRVRVNLVSTYFSARDKGGFLTGLHKDDCQVYENKELQPIRNFTQEKTLPLTIGLVIDTSYSQDRVLPMEKDAGIEFLKTVMTPKDEAFLISASINVDLVADVTNSVKELRRGMQNVQTNSGTGSGSVTGNTDARGTLLYDAVYLAAHDKLAQETGRKVIIVLSDGGDQGSQLKLRDAIEAAQKSNAIVYVVLISDPDFRINGRAAGEAEMDKLAHDTGGRSINIGTNPKKLDSAFQQIADELRTQYLISYVPKNTSLDGKFRTIDIDCGKGAKIQARKGYFAVADQAE